MANAQHPVIPFLRIFDVIKAKEFYLDNGPGLEQAFWNALCMKVIEPFGNKLLSGQDIIK